MANLSENPVFDSVIQIELMDPVQGGPGGKTNQPLQNLTNRTAYLKQHVDALESNAAGLAPLNSPTLTGDPKAPTPPLGDNDTSIPTTSFVQATVGGVLNKSVAGGANVTLSAIEAGNGILSFTGLLTANINVVVPTSPTFKWVVKNKTTGAFTLTIKTSLGAGVSVPQNASLSIYTDGTDVLSSVTDSVSKTGDTLIGALNAAPPITLASASTVNIGAANSNNVTISGAVTIVGFDAIAAGAERKVTFSGALNLTHNAASLILPSGANITTAAGDTAIFVSLGSGNWRCLVYQKANGQAIVAGGFTGGTLSSALNYAPPATVASATTTDIGAVTSNSITVTGAVTITGLGSIAAGAERFVTFAGALTLTHNAASLILPGGANITTAAGDVAYFVSLGSGNWRCTGYQKANGQAVIAGSFTGGTLTSALNYAPTASIASAATTDIGASSSNSVSVTGSATITALGTIASGVERIVTFAGALTLTHNAASLILPGAANITTAAGDVAYFVSLGGGNWRCTGYQRANGRSIIEQKIADWFNRAVYTATNSFVVPAGVSKIRAYAIGKGGDATAGTSATVFGTAGSGGGCAYGEIAVTPGSTVSVNISAGVATVVYNSTTMLTANPGSTGGSGGTASKDASVTNGGAYSGGNVPGLNGGHGGSSAGSPLGAGTYGSPASTTGTGAGAGGAGIGGPGGSAISSSTDCSCGGGGGAGGSTGSSGLGGAISNPGSGGGAGGSGTNALGSSAGGSGRTLGTFFTDPILAHMTGAGASSKPFILSSANYEDANNAPHGGGGAGTGSYGTNGGHGGDGGGGGGAGGCKASGQTVQAGNGGLFGGGGSVGSSVTGSTVKGGNGGYGGGGGAAGWANGGTATGGTGGSAAVFIFY